LETDSFSRWTQFRKPHTDKCLLYLPFWLSLAEAHPPVLRGQRQKYVFQKWTFLLACQSLLCEALSARRPHWNPLQGQVSLAFPLETDNFSHWTRFRKLHTEKSLLNLPVWLSSAVAHPTVSRGQRQIVIFKKWTFLLAFQSLLGEALSIPRPHWNPLQGKVSLAFPLEINYFSHWTRFRKLYTEKSLLYLPVWLSSAVTHPTVSRGQRQKVIFEKLTFLLACQFLLGEALSVWRAYWNPLQGKICLAFHLELNSFSRWTRFRKPHTDKCLLYLPVWLSFAVVHPTVSRGQRQIVVFEKWTFLLACQFLLGEALLVYRPHWNPLQGQVSLAFPLETNSFSRWTVRWGSIGPMAQL
jgi:hypothetical protein